MGLTIALGVLALTAVALVVFVATIYNTLVKLKNRYKNAFAQIEVQLVRRHDLIPNLVETVKGYMAHERETLEAVITARNQAAGLLQAAKNNIGDQSAMANLAGAETALTSAMGGLFAVMEQYPDLKASEQVTALQEEVTSTENRVAFARQHYNDAATTFNTARQSFPTVLIAPAVGYKDDAALLEFDDAVKEVPSAAIT
jgi:LemA protein